MLNLSDISDFEDVKTTSSNKEVPALDDVFGTLKVTDQCLHKHFYNL